MSDEKGAGLCAVCAHCKALSIDKRVDCDMGISGKAKIICRLFEEKKEE